MVDPRIYRAGWVIVFVALVVFGFSLKSGPPATTTNLAPGASFSGAYADAASLAARFGAVTPGSGADQQMAAELARELRGAGGFAVSTADVAARTAAGERSIATVEAQRPGLGQGTVVVIANRDAAIATAHSSALTAATRTTAPSAGASMAPLAASAASAVLVDLARAVGGATLDRSLLLISTSGSVGAAGATQLAKSLTSGPIDAVIVLGDLADSDISQPVAVPWSQTDLLAPPMLVATINGALSSEANINGGYPSFGSEVAQLAFPFATGSQAPFAAAGIPAIGVSLSGDRIPSAAEPTSPTRLAGMGLALEEAVDALDSGPTVPAPSAYLTVSGQLIPLWAFRLLVLGLIVPVAMTLIDALARARRRGHSVLSWVVWVLSSIAPFVVGFLVLRLAGLSGIVAAPSGAAATGLPASAAGVVVIVLAVVLTAVAFRLLRPVGVQVASGIGWRRTPTSPVIEGAVVALSIVLCGLALVVWLFNPFAAILLVPALHLWMWLGSPGVIVSRVRATVLLLAGLILPVLVVLYFMLSLGIAPWDFLWALALALAGGAISAATALSWCVTAGVLAGAVVLLARSARAATHSAEAPVTVRGPLGYAGPGSLGGTESALRR